MRSLLRAEQEEDGAKLLRIQSSYPPMLRPGFSPAVLRQASLLAGRVVLRVGLPEKQQARLAGWRLL